MKKKIFLSLVLSVFAFCATAKSWENYAGIGVNVPFSMMNASLENSSDANDEDRNITQIGYGAEVQYIGVHSNGFSLKTGFSVGCITSDDIDVQNYSRNVGFYENLAIGLGYSFIHTDTYLLGLAAMGGVEIAQYSDDWNRDKDDVNHNYTDSISLVSVSVGGDIFYVYNIGRRFGFFGNIGARYVPLGAGKREFRDKWVVSNITNSKTEQFDIDIAGKFIINPTFGVMWHF